MDMKDKTAEPFDSALIKMSNILARKTPRHSKNKETLSMTEQRLFYMVLSQANTVDEKGIVKLKKSEVFKKLGIDDKDMWSRYKDYFKSMQMKTYYDFNYSEDEFESGFLIYKVSTTKNYFCVKFDNDYISLLKKADKWTTMFFDDIMKFECKHTAPLYQRLRSLNKHPKFDKYYDFNTSELKEIFGLSADDYVKKSGSQVGSFDRLNFEKYTLNKAIEEINTKSSLTHNVWYEKHKKGNRVAFYRIYFENLQLPSIGDENIMTSTDTIPIEKTIEDGDYLNYQLFRECLNYLEPITNAQIREIYELATEYVEQSNTFEIDIYKYLSSKVTQLKAYNQPITSKRGLIKTFINADIKKKHEEIYQAG